jgi:N-acetylmuramoyl-L-alanine amidase
VAETEKTVEEAKANDGYTIQLLASDKKIKTSDSQFKTYRNKVKCYIGGGKLKYKYCYGEFASRSEAQRKLSDVKRTFKDAFVVHYNGENIVK